MPTDCRASSPSCRHKLGCADLVAGVMRAPHFSRMSLWRPASMHSGGIDGAAAVAGPAAGRLLLSEISPEEHASAFFGLGVISDGPKPLLALVTKSLELRDEIPGS